MTPDATDLAAQLTALKQTDSDTVFVTTGVEQMTLALRQAVEQRLGKRIVTTGGSFPDQLIANPLPAGNDSFHILFYAPWFPEKAPHPALAATYTAEWNKKGWEFAGLTEGFRGYDAMLTVVEAIRIAGKAEPEAIRDALWKVKIAGRERRHRLPEGRPGRPGERPEPAERHHPETQRRQDQPDLMDQALQHLVNGTVLGGTYALLGIGLTLVFGVMRVVNFTHGELYAFGAYMTYALVSLAGVNFFAALVLATLAGVALGALLELVLLRRMRGADIDSVMLVMIGAALVLQNGEMWIWGGVAKLIPNPFAGSPLVFGPVSVLPLRLFVLATAAALLLGFWLALDRTRAGMAMRATFQDPQTAALMGVRIGWVNTATFALGSGLAAASGALLGPVFMVSPTMGDLVGLKAFAIVILGGLGSLPGATLGGFALGFVEEFAGGYLSTEYRDAFGFLLIILVLALKPQGLVPAKERIG